MVTPLPTVGPGERGGGVVLLNGLLGSTAAVETEEIFGIALCVCRAGRPGVGAGLTSLDFCAVPAPLVMLVASNFRPASGVVQRGSVENEKDEKRFD